MQKLATSVDTKEKFDFAATQMLEMLRKHGHSDAADYLFVGFIDLLTSIKSSISETVLVPFAGGSLGTVQSH